MATIATLALTDFRNYATLEAEFPPGPVVLLGPNGQGKTNLLEAIYFLSLLRSFRTRQPRELLRWQQPCFRLRATVAEGERRRLLALEYGSQRQLRVDGQPISRASDFIGHLLAVAFVPEDLAVVKGVGSLRRRFCDVLLSQLDHAYLSLLQDYVKVLKSRNQLLRQGIPEPRALAAFDGVLSRCGAQLTRRRQAFFATFAPHLQAQAARLFPSEYQLSITYQPSVAAAADEDEAAGQAALLAALTAGTERDLRNRVTMTGPHRDDFSLELNGRALDVFGSEGQCRLSALALKLAALAQLSADLGPQRVILLVDDVIGELDPRARAAFLASIGQAAQVFLACTSTEVLPGLPPAALYQVAAGVLTRKG